VRQRVTEGHVQSVPAGDKFHLLDQGYGGSRSTVKVLGMRDKVRDLGEGLMTAVS
jgi:hypothetical protein